MCGAYFDLDTGVLLTLIDDRDSSFCCGSDAWTGRAVYGEPLLLVCAE